MMTAVPVLSWETSLLSLATEACSEVDLPRIQLETEQKELHQAFTLCAQVTARYSRTFYLATSLLPPAKRRAIQALYAFCRTADDLVDEQQDGGAGWEAFREQVLMAAPVNAGPVNTACDSILLAWAVTRSRFAIPQCYVEQFLDGVGYDLLPHRCASFSDLAAYSYGVASTVGLMSMYIIGFRGQEAARYAVRLGVALQVTNVLRDVGEDLACGRVYLPLDELRAFELGEADLAQAPRDERWTAFLRFQIARCRQLYQAARPGIRLLHPDGRFAVAAAADLYCGILDDIESHGYDVFSRRAHLTGRGKVTRLPGILLRTLFAAQA